MSAGVRLASHIIDSTLTNDVLIVGAGPGGSSCAAFCARGGLKTVVVERALFPREKVCGDCLNPLAWPVLDRLALSERVRDLPHALLDAVEFVGTDGRRIVVEIPHSSAGEIAVKRSALDSLLLDRARELGAEVREETTVTGVERKSDAWVVQTSTGEITSRFLVAADGRNSTVARLLGLQPRSRKDRVALQTHLPLPAELRGRVRMQFISYGYTGLADIGNNEANLCLVARPEHLEDLRSWAAGRYRLSANQTWRTVTPLSRSEIHPVAEDLLLIGDAARVVEPFTGEGISYALRTGELAAQALISGDLPFYRAGHSRLYRGRVWVNDLARQACLHPEIATRFLQLANLCPGILRVLTRKIIVPLDHSSARHGTSDASFK